MPRGCGRSDVTDQGVGGQAQWHTKGAKEPSIAVLKTPDLIGVCAAATVNL